MKRKVFFITLMLVFWLALAGGAFAVTPGTAVISKQDFVSGEVRLRTLTVLCVGDEGDGTVADVTTSSAETGFILGWYLISVEAFPTVGGTAPDAADVMVKTASGLDMLGSEDGATAYAGLTLVHATLPRMCLPNLYLPRAGEHLNYYYPITGAITISTSNQGTVDAEWTIVLTFAR